MLTWIGGGCCNKGGEESVIKLLAYSSFFHSTAQINLTSCLCSSDIDSNPSVSTFNNLFISGPAVSARTDRDDLCVNIA